MGERLHMILARKRLAMRELEIAEKTANQGRINDLHARLMRLALEEDTIRNRAIEKDKEMAKKGRPHLVVKLGEAQKKLMKDKAQEFLDSGRPTVWQKLDGTIVRVKRVDGKIVTIPEEPMFAQVKENDAPVQFEILQDVRFLQTVRKFVVREGFAFRNNNRHMWRAGDILEERVDKPNVLVNVSKLQRENDAKFTTWQSNLEIAYINRSNVAVAENRRDFVNCGNKIDFVENIPATDSFVMDKYGKKIATKLKSKLRQQAKVNEDVTILKGLLGVEDEEEG